MNMPASIIQSERTLQTLLHGIADAPPIPLTGVSDDSRNISSGSLFVAYAGERTHGMEHLAQAFAAGAAAAVFDSDSGEPPTASYDRPVIAISGLRNFTGLLADRWYESPSESLNVLAVTGTNGKTTISTLLAQSMQTLGRRCGYIGTLGKGIEQLVPTGGLTTPSCFTLHATLAEFKDAGATDVAMEVSSHALTQGRVDGVRIDTAIFSNLTRDHIDYHGSMRNYFDAKATLFSRHNPSHSIVNIDSEYGLAVADLCGKEIVVVSTNFERVSNGRPFAFARAVVADQTGSKIRFDSSWGSAEYRVNSPGRFNVENSMLVMATLLNDGVAIDSACEVLQEAKAPAGRMQLVTMTGVEASPAVFVDFAHTPAGLELALRSLRDHAGGRLWCVFGCGGDRDRGKRPQMGKIASRLANKCIVTSDNPRTESPTKIIADILSGMSRDVEAIEDRATAIAYAISEANDDDVILIAGKGHEDYQLVGAERIRFSDYATAQTSLRQRRQAGVSKND